MADKFVQLTSAEGSEFKVPCDVGKTSDGYHSFDDLYEHRHALFLALQQAYPEIAWKSYKHHDDKNIEGPSWEGWFIAGLQLPTGQITYHLPDRLWDACKAKELEFAPEWDRHMSNDVVDRLYNWINLHG